MAHYLPVLMHSVTANIVPDDSALETQARGQVDYLSHDWREEDVWRSWRNMTRQKNEITNGMRLENASWRTWWKQRNKLPTVNPETLNWLKDSDVTWLYGPLHTAVDWSPPPKPRDHLERAPASAHDRLDLSTTPKQKSILKYRSISELLTSDLPTSPVFSPSCSDGECEDHLNHPKQRRPSLVHTKSDTHITRWGPDRTFRKDSPPRIEPPGAAGSTSSNTLSNSRPARVNSTTNLTGYFTSHLGSQAPSSSQPSSSNSNSASTSPRGPTSELAPNSGVPQKKKHITFNTFVEQCIAIDKPKGIASDERFETIDEDGDIGDDDGYDEDVENEDEFDADWGLNECAITDSDSDFDEDIFIEDQDDDDDEDDAEDFDNEGVIEMRSSRHSSKDGHLKTPRSKSKTSTSSSSSAESYSSSSASGKKRRSLPPNVARRRRSGTTHSSSTTRRPSLAATLSRNTPSPGIGSDHSQQMVTIAPIAPTILKTGSATNYAYPGSFPAWDGFGVHEDGSAGSRYGAWMDSFGDEAFSDDGGFAAIGGYRSSGSESAGTPVELVYMPPPSGRYGSSYGGRSSSFGSTGTVRVRPIVNGAEAEIELMEDADEERLSGSAVQSEEPQSSREQAGKLEQRRSKETEEEGSVYHHQEALFSTDGSSKQDRKPPRSSGPPGIVSPSLPIVVKTPPAVDRAGKGSGEEIEEEDAYDYFGGPDLGEDYTRRNSRAQARRKIPKSSDERRGRSRSSPSSSPSSLDPRDDGSERKSRSRSRSKSRTPSPQAPSSSTPAISVPGRSGSFDRSGSSSSLLSPPLRGRGAVINTSPESSGSRGRSSTRTSSSLSDRERPRSHHGSPLGSLSPEGSAIGIAYGVYANGRISDRERDRDRDRSQRSSSRGRERRERKLSHSLSPEGVENVTSVTSPSLSSSVSSDSVTPSSPSHPTSESVTSSEFSESGTSSASSSQTIVPSSEPKLPVINEPSRTTSLGSSRDEGVIRASHPTPANSPAMSMSGAAHAIAKMNYRSPIDITQPHMSSPRMSYSTSSVDPSTSMPVSSSPNIDILPRESLVSSRKSASDSDKAPNSPTSSASKQGTDKEPTSPTEDSIVGKAVGIMSSARAYLGLWNHNGSHDRGQH
ncbi:protein phosphatase regulator [Paramarasmius palmivorus]|uniref:Protein phosphatase regulator n=1 Tax=Paramarasmius palmivorus TaxID=297713 RepID=A0AAW0DXY8_9AGAR